MYRGIDLSPFNPLEIVGVQHISAALCADYLLQLHNEEVQAQVGSNLADTPELTTLTREIFAATARLTGSFNGPAHAKIGFYGRAYLANTNVPNDLHHSTGDQLAIVALEVGPELRFVWGPKTVRIGMRTYWSTTLREPEDSTAEILDVLCGDEKIGFVPLLPPVECPPGTVIHLRQNPPIIKREKDMGTWMLGHHLPTSSEGILTLQFTPAYGESFDPQRISYSA